MGKTKIKLFKRWLHENEDTSLVLAPIAEQMSNKEFASTLISFEAKGYALDERGAPIGLDDDKKHREIIMALHETFEEATGYPLIDWYLKALEEKRFEEKKPLLDKFRKWLVDVSKSAEEQRWWHHIPWSLIKYEVLNMIVDSLDEWQCHPVDEEGVPMRYEGEDLENFYSAIGESILNALVQHAMEVTYEPEEE